MKMIIQGSFTTLFLALTAVTATGVLVSFKNIGIKLCQEKCFEHCKYLSIEYSIESLTCRLLDVEAKSPEEGYIVRRKREPDASSLMSKGSLSSKACMKDGRCLVTRSGKETCVKDNRYLGTEELNRQSAENPTQESEKTQKKLLQAVKSGNLWSVKNILDSGLADINAKSRDGKTPILIAAGSGKRRVFELLMTNGADMCAVHKSLGTILHFAINGGNFDILKLIVRAHKVDINRGNGIGVTPLEWARCKHMKRMVAFLKHNGAAENPTQESEKAGKKLLQAVKSGSLQSVKNILDSGLADINAKSRDGKTPILIAAGSGKTRVFELLMTKGADMCEEHKSLGTILHFAINGGNVDILKLILRAHKVDINRGNGIRVTPLEWARCKHRKQMVTLLKRNGGQPAFFDLFNDGQ